MTEFEIVIGLEVHVQLATKSKIFCTSSTEFGADPNSWVDPVTFGLPGALPVANKKVIDYAIMLGLGLGCEIREYNRFARKHYFYPDLPKGYQISQFDEPICERGKLEIKVEDTTRTIGITRIHMEEDAGKSIHDSRTQASLIDLNRAGTPLLEVVSEPDLRSAAEASAYLKSLRQIVRYLGISDGNMDEGSLRCDANVSLRPLGQLKYGTRTEVKNLNSFKFVEAAIDYEVARQLQILKSGNTITQETRLYDSTKNVTRAMRDKEDSADYRYFPDPDLPPIVVNTSWINSVKEVMPNLPSTRKAELISKYELSEYDANILTQERSYSDYFQEVFDICKNAKLSSNWITSELFGLLNKSSLELEKSPITSENLGKLIVLIDTDQISGKMAKTVFEEMFETSKSPDTIVNEKGLKQITDDSQIQKIILEVIEKNPTQLAGYLSGREALFGYFVGQVMSATKGTANPKKVNDLLKKELNSRK